MTVAMPTPLLQTKLEVPPTRPDLVARPQLVERLDEARRLGHKVCLVSAPTGFGKTTLLSAWVAGMEHTQVSRPVAWLALDGGDNDPLRFWAHLVAALQAVQPGAPHPIGESALAALRSPQPPPVQSVLVCLVNELSALPGLVLILDDHHTVNAAEVHDALAFLVEHQPPQMLLVIATRSDPPLPLSRLRARGQLTEIRAADLRFTLSEAAAFVESTAGLALAPEQVVALTARTEGWVAGLQLAGLALKQQPREQLPGFVQAFTGSHRFVLDYLVEEVLGRQEPGLQAFLLQTSILERLTGPLCDAVLGEAAAAPGGSQQTLWRLEAANLFTLPLDGERRWSLAGAQAATPSAGWRRS